MYNIPRLNSIQKIVINVGAILFIVFLFFTFVIELYPFVTGSIFLVVIVFFTLFSYILASKYSGFLKIPSPIKKILKNPILKKVHVSKDKNVRKLDDLSSATGNRLYKLSSVFPFDLFPDDIVIEQKQVVIVQRNFFYSSEQFQISIKDILAPVIESNFFFSKLKLELGAGGFKQNPPSISHLKKEEARKARRIIMGLVVANKENIELSGMDHNEMLRKIEKVGSYSTI